MKISLTITVISFPSTFSLKNFILKPPFTIYFGLINSVPAPWKLAIKKTPPHVAKNDNKTKKISTKSREQNCEIWFHSGVYELPFQIKNDIKTTMFQYKIIHNILPTKVSLFRAKICDDDICPLCLADRHSLDHMFFRCKLTLSFWDLFQTSKTKENTTLTDSMILYGIFDNREHLYSLNYSLLLEKYSIYSSCLQEKKLYFDSFLTLLREKINLQREIAVHNNNITKFNIIYRPLFFRLFFFGLYFSLFVFSLFVFSYTNPYIFM